MIKPILIIVFCLSISISFGQQKKILRYFKDYTRLDASPDYPTNEKDPRAIVIPSTTYIGDTSGLKFNNEYVAFRQNDVMGSSDQTWHFRFIHTEPTTVSEYREYQNYLRDSLFREQLYERVKDDKEAAKMLMLNKQVIAEMNENLENRSKDFGYKDRKDNRSYFNLNWKYPLTPEKGWQAALLRDYYLPQSERFYGKREFDWRKVIFSYYTIHLNGFRNADTLKKRRSRQIIEYKTPVIAHTYSWSASSKSMNDEVSVLGQTYLDLLPNEPVTGITGMQANAFCAWKQKQIEQELKKQNLPYFVTITLPKISDLELVPNSPEFSVPEKDYTSQWRISVNEYKAFVQAVRDSIELEHLYNAIPSDKDAAKLLAHPDFYTVDQTYRGSGDIPFDPVEREENRLFFTLKYNTPIVKKYKSLLTDIRSQIADKSLVFTYCWMDAVTRGFEPKLVIGQENVLVTEYYETARKRSVDSRPSGELNELNQHSGVRIFEDLQPFIIREYVEVVPEIPLAGQVDNELVKGLTYEQAKAFYNWKYPIHQAKQGDDWQQLVLPTREQFELVQSGGTAIIPAHALEFPTPTFHYVVHVTKDFSPRDDGKVKLR